MIISSDNKAVAFAFKCEDGSSYCNPHCSYDYHYYYHLDSSRRIHGRYSKALFPKGCK